MSPDWELDKGRKKFEGPAWQKISEEIKYGTLVAYVLRGNALPNEDGEYNAVGKDGKHDKLGRVLIKMFESSDGHVTFETENRSYGTITPNQLKIIKTGLRKIIMVLTARCLLKIQKCMMMTKLLRNI
jgi:hypothetical protein